MKPVNMAILVCWVRAVLEHALTLPEEEVEVFLDLELERLEADFGVPLLREGLKVYIPTTFGTA